MLTPEGAKFASEVEENKTPGDKGERGVAGGETLSAWLEKESLYSSVEMMLVLSAALKYIFWYISGQKI